VHRHAPESVKLLADHGLDFAAHRAHGVEARVFAAHLMSSGLVCSGGGGGGGVTWATFHSAYDFGYLLKLLIGRKLPKTLPEFLGLVRVFFGDEVYDVKHMMKRCPWLGGGLDGVAAAVGVQREAGRAHQAGSDSALTWDAFRRIREVFFAKEGVRGSAGVLYGLELEGNLIAAAVDEKSKCGAISSAAATGNGKCGAGLVVGGAAATGKGNGGRRAGRKFGHNNNRAVAALR
jgi:CCR4-NOT transcription complex subunit 7/8